MSDDKIEAKDGDKGSEQDRVSKFGDEVHPDLRWLIISANSQEHAMNSPVTVWVKGAQICGQVASAKEGRLWFMKKWLDGVKHNTKIHSKEKLTEEQEAIILRGIRSGTEKYEPELLGEIENAPPAKRYEFLTLKEARVWGMGGGTGSYMRVEYIRIRLDQIDAFTLGEFVAD